MSFYDGRFKSSQVDQEILVNLYPLTNQILAKAKN